MIHPHRLFVLCSSRFSVIALLGFPAHYSLYYRPIGHAEAYTALHTMSSINHTHRSFHMAPTLILPVFSCCFQPWIHHTDTPTSWSYPHKGSTPQAWPLPHTNRTFHTRVTLMLLLTNPLFSHHTQHYTILTPHSERCGRDGQANDSLNINLIHNIPDRPSAVAVAVENLSIHDWKTRVLGKVFSHEIKCLFTFPPLDL